MNHTVNIVYHMKYVFAINAVFNMILTFMKTLKIINKRINSM